MKTLLRKIRHLVAAAGEYLKSAGQQARRKVAALWQLVRRKMTLQQNAIQRALLTLWRRHKTNLAWSAATAIVTVIVTAALIYLGYREPAVNRWVTALLSGTLRLPAGYALRLIGPMAGGSVHAITPLATADPVGVNGPDRRQSVAA